MKASSLSFQAAVLLVLVGMGWGLAMGISGDHTTHPGHAHLNLLGWVSLFLFGIFYHLHPKIDQSRAAVRQVWVWIVATVVMAFGIGLVHSGYEQAEPMIGVASLVIFADMAFFGWIVFRRERVAHVPSSSIPAE